MLPNWYSGSPSATPILSSSTTLHTSPGRHIPVAGFSTIATPALSRTVPAQSPAPDAPPHAARPATVATARIFVPRQCIERTPGLEETLPAHRAELRPAAAPSGRRVRQARARMLSAPGRRAQRAPCRRAMPPSHLRSGQPAGFGEPPRRPAPALRLGPETTYIGGLRRIHAGAAARAGGGRLPVMVPMNASEIRQRFLDYFARNGHR